MTTAIPPAALDEMRTLLGPAGWLDAPGDLEPFLVDHRRLYRGATPIVTLPDSTAQVAAIVGVCARHGVGIVPHAGNTSYCGAATPRETGREIVLSLRRLRRIRAVDPLNYSITVEAGCVLAEVQRAAEAVERLFPLSLGSGGSCQIGGNLSTNAGGTAVLRYGMMRELVLGLEVVLPDGLVLDQLRGLRKDNTGYDLRNLFIGAEGTLGVITAACLKLFPLPPAHATAIIAVNSIEAAVALLGRLRGELGDSVTTCELMPRLAVELASRHIQGVQDPFREPHPWYLLTELSLPQLDSDLGTRLQEILADAIQRRLAADAVLAQSEAQREAMWRLRERIPEAQTREGASLKHDISVETQRVPEFVREGAAIVETVIPDARLVAYGHLGDGNLHFNVSPAIDADAARFLARGPELLRAIHDLVARFRGSFSAEHGIGRLKVGELERYEDPVALDLMRRIKSALDPQGIMNPGKVLRAAD